MICHPHVALAAVSIYQEASRPDKPFWRCSFRCCILYIDGTQFSDSQYVTVDDLSCIMVQSPYIRV